MFMSTAVVALSLLFGSSLSLPIANPNSTAADQTVAVIGNVTQVALNETTPSTTSAVSSPTIDASPTVVTPNPATSVTADDSQFINFIQNLKFEKRDDILDLPPDFLQQFSGLTFIDPQSDQPGEEVTRRGGGLGSEYFFPFLAGHRSSKQGGGRIAGSVG